MATGFLSTCGLMLYPIMWWQGRNVRRSTPQLPEAGGPSAGVEGAGKKYLQALVIGDSTAAGVGARQHAAALPGFFSAKLHEKTGHAIRWEVSGRSGAAAIDLGLSLLPEVRADQVDVVLVAIGVNDVLQWTSGRSWQKRLGAFEYLVQNRFGPVPVIYSCLPPMGLFPALPAPLRNILSVRSRYLNGLLFSWCLCNDERHFLAMDFPADPSLFATDGFHPSAACYAIWGEEAADLACDLLKKTVSSS